MGQPLPLSIFVEPNLGDETVTFGYWKPDRWSSEPYPLYQLDSPAIQDIAVTIIERLFGRAPADHG
jgi:hypothetical protein